ncbi:MAG: SHOCT domain-containing protein [Hyphomicrobiales bacterium]
MPLLHMIWSIFLIFLLVAWIWVIIGVISDIFQSHDIGGWTKGFWVLFVIAIPWLGVLMYLVVRGKGMQERNAQALIDAKEAQRTYIQSIASSSVADELSKLSDLKEKGVLTETEYETQKAKILSE